MNNAQLAIEEIKIEIESPIDTKPMLRERSVKLEQIVDAFNKINESNYWKVLQTEVFSGVLNSLQSRLNKERDAEERVRLQGQIAWAEKYCDLTKLSTVYQKELQNLTKQINA